MYISIIDDEQVLCKKVQKKLEREGYNVQAFFGYNDFMQNGDDMAHLYIIDISLGDGSGFDIIKWIRTTKKNHAPIIITSGYGDSENIIYGLNIGADDYMTKPFIPDELIARVKALLRRPAWAIAPFVLRYGNISLDIAARTTRFGAESVHLTGKEMLMLELFINNVGKVVSRERLITHVWWGNKLADVSDNTINASLSMLRKKFQPALPISAIYGHGYILDEYKE